jgi:hypothetical protein
MHDEEVAARGRRAGAEYRELESAFARVEDAYLTELLKAPMGGDERILGLHMAIQNLRGVKQVLLDAIANGKVSEELIERAEKRRL